MRETDARWMREALRAAREAAARGGVPRCDAGVFPRAPLVDRELRSFLFAERSHSGLVHRSRKPEWVKAHRGFESHPLRHRFLATKRHKKLKRIPLGLN